MPRIQPLLTAGDSSWQNIPDYSIYAILEREGPMTLGTISKQIGIARTPLYAALSRLMVRRLVEEIFEPNLPFSYLQIYYRAAEHPCNVG
ncbi:MAG: helix-turn-helix domain-containing protein [Candidatus Heimdallarchaeota archaeon]